MVKTPNNLLWYPARAGVPAGSLGLALLVSLLAAGGFGSLDAATHALRWDVACTAVAQVAPSPIDQRMLPGRNGLRLGSAAGRVAEGDADVQAAPRRTGDDDLPAFMPLALRPDTVLHGPHAIATVRPMVGLAAGSLLPRLQRLIVLMC